MYKVLCDGKALHNDELQSLRIIGGKLSLELGKTGAFEFTIYPNHPYYDAVNPVLSIIEVYRNEHSIFRGRALAIKYGFYNEKQVFCEGELAFLLDSIVPPHAYSGSFVQYLDYIIGIHNSQVEPEKQFAVGSRTVADFFPFDVVEAFEFLTSFDTINKRMVESTGGYLQVRHQYSTMYLDLLVPEMNIGDVSAQKIRLGKNLLDIKKEIEGSEVFSGIVPLGAKVDETERRLNISSVNGGSYAVTNADAVAAYGKIYKTVVFDDITDAYALLSRARTYVAEKFASVNTIEITAADLSGLNPDLDSFSVGQWVEVVSDAHFNEPQIFLIRKMSIDISRPTDTKIEAGRTKQGLTDELGNVVDNIGSLMSRLQSVAGSISGISATAAAAEAKANSAATTANSATTAANNAATAAKSATTAANNAATTANNANTKATAAQTTANTAASNATNALSRVSALETQAHIVSTGTTGIWRWKKFSDNTCEFFGKVPVTAYAISTALGTWYRGANLYEATAYQYPFTMTEAPAVEMTFQTRNGLAALLWINSPDADTAQKYLPQAFLIRPTTATGIYGNINIIGKGKL